MGEDTDTSRLAAPGALILSQVGALGQLIELIGGKFQQCTKVAVFPWPIRPVAKLHESIGQLSQEFRLLAPFSCIVRGYLAFLDMRGVCQVGKPAYPEQQPVNDRLRLIGGKFNGCHDLPAFALVTQHSAALVNTFPIATVTGSALSVPIRQHAANM
jgi:hypothetical protein